jgi:hypothetical protein
MHESERNKLKKRQTALLLAASDMEQTVAAAHALAAEQEKDLARALETAIVVCYMRPFAGGDLGLSADDIPTEPGEAQRHESLKKQRDRVHAHSDKASGRKVQIQISGFDGEVVTVTGREQWLPFPRDLLPLVIEHAELLKQRFQIAAVNIQVRLDEEGLGH